MPQDKPEQPDLVDVYQEPFVRPLGNLVILFAKAEAELLQLVAEVSGTDDPGAAELAAHEIYNSTNAKPKIFSLLSASQVKEPEKRALLRVFEDFWCDKESRNRLIHDEWYPSLGAGEVLTATRGILRKGRGIAYDKPTPEKVW